MTRRIPTTYGIGRRTYDALASRDQAAIKVNQDQRFPGVVILRAVAENA